MVRPENGPKRVVQLVIALAVAVVLLVLPASASAIVYCVDTSPGRLEDNDSIDPSCETPTATVRSGAEAAAADPGEDTVLIGPGDYVLPQPSGGLPDVSYRSAQVLHIRGLEEPHFTLGSTFGYQYGFDIEAGAGSTIEGLRLTIPANSDGLDYGFVFAGRIEYAGEPIGPVTLKDINIDGPQASKAVAVVLEPGAVLADSSVAFPISPLRPNTAVLIGGGSGGAVVGDTLAADIGVEATDPGIVERSSISARTGVISEHGEFALRDSIIRMADENEAVGVRFSVLPGGAGLIRGTIDGVTIVGGAAGETTGVRVQSDESQEGVKVAMANTVIEGPAHAIQVWSGNERQAELNVGYSNYDPAKVEVRRDVGEPGKVGLSIYSPSHVTDFNPGFVNPTAGDFRLAPGSPLIDTGDPAAPTAGRLDLSGLPRALAGTCEGAPRRDIGAYESVPICPPPGSGDPGKTPTEGPSENPSQSPTESPTGSPDSPAAQPSDGRHGTSAGPGSPGRPDSTQAAPDTEIEVKGKRRRVVAGGRTFFNFVLSSTAQDVSYRCRVDSRPFRNCASRSFFVLGPGKHAIVAFAISDAGVPDPTPAAMGVDVVRKKRP